MKDSILRQKTFAFAVKIVRLVQRLQSEKKEYVLSRQILKSGTSIGANDHEAEFAQSKDDFVSKMSISLKETNETAFFLRLLHATDYIEDKEFTELFNDCGEIKAMLISSVKTAKSSIRRKIYSLFTFFTFHY
jgi:four helix bundle protein